MFPERPSMAEEPTPLAGEAPAVTRSSPCALSLVVPAYDEEDNLALLYQRVRAVFGPQSDWELVLIDDGSRDGTARVIRELARGDARVVGVFLARNCGQSAALAAGAREARGSVIATLDADLQNDPADLPPLIAALAGWDAVVGYRLRRRDTFVRRASSRIANAVRNWISRDDIRDTGCSLKVFRAEALATIPWFDGMHRFLPTLLRYRGLGVLELPVSHHPRNAGRSKYGIKNRAWRGIQDLLAVRWMRARMLRPSVREVLRAH
jgi:glycosyltransferase involved in cell wall biosynthesis